VENLKSIIVCSGKGGVGKTLVSSSIIRGLLNQGLKVGAIDLDIDNPNLAEFMKVNGTIGFNYSSDGKKILLPVQHDNLKLFSMSLVAPDSPIGMLGQQSGSLCQDVIEFGDWSGVDYIVVDAPAGTGDELRAAVRGLKGTLVGSVIVAQPAHLYITERVIKLHKLNGIPILGLIENMTSFKCEHGKEYKLFGEPGGKALAEKYGVNFIGEIPLSVDVSVNKYAENDTIANTIKLFVEGEPKKIGFLEAISDRAKKITVELLAKTLTDLFMWINSEIPIGEIQQKFRYPGGRLIRFNLLSDDMKILSQEHFMVQDGQLVFVRKTRENIQELENEVNSRGVKIYAKVIPLLESIVGRKKVDGEEIDFDMRTAWLNGDIWTEGKPGDMVQTLDFFSGVWEYIKNNKRAEALKIVGGLIS
jgi:ATP-binding protein involved in chromosome partitioning